MEGRPALQQFSSPGTNVPRNYNVDLIKLLSCLAVIGLHVFYNKNSVASSIVYYLCGFSVPSFFMSTGYFVMNRKSACREYAVRKFLGLLRLLLLWDVLEFGVRVIIRAARGQDLSAFGPVGLAKAVVRSIIQKGALWETMWHFWYLAALMILYLLLPLLYRLYVGDQSPDDRFSSLFRLWAGLAYSGPADLLLHRTALPEVFLPDIPSVDMAPVPGPGRSGAPLADRGRKTSAASPARPVPLPDDRLCNGLSEHCRTGFAAQSVRGILL